MSLFIDPRYHGVGYGKQAMAAALKLYFDVLEVADDAAALYARSHRAASELGDRMPVRS